MLQVSSVSFFEHHIIEGEQQSSGGGPLPHSIRRLCVMETEVTNRTEGPLQVQALSLFSLLLTMLLETHTVR